MARYEDNHFDLIVTDPPYLFNKSPGKPYSERKQCNAKGAFGKSELYSFDGFMMKEMASFDEVNLVEFLNETKRILNIYNGYYFCSEAQIPFYCNWANKNNLMFSVLVWEKPLSIINKNRYSQNTEFIIRIYDYGTGLIKTDINKCYNRVKKYNSPSGKIHPTQKPVALIEEILRVTKKGKVLEPFLGSGSIAIACHNLGFDLTACELDKEYYDAAIKRISDHQKQIKLF